MKKVLGQMVIVVLVLASVTACVSEEQIIDSVREGHFHSHADSDPIGTAFAEVAETTEWSYNGEASEGLHTVTLDAEIGHAQVDEMNSLRMIFEVNEGDWSFQITNAYWNGDRMDNMTLGLMIDSVYATYNNRDEGNEV